MKTLITSLFALLVAAGTTVKAQDEYLGLPGDNLNLYAVMNLFQQSATIEEFERNLNDENTKINNLDLNGDNYVDYITVSDYVDGNVHNIVLQDAISPTEKQDVAVFTVQRFRDGSVQIQLIGDEDLYGRNYIVEPIYDETPNPGYSGRGNRNITIVHTTPYDIAAWPVIRFIFEPTYVVWRSSWHWGYYPHYWHAWSPFYYHYYYGYHHNFFPEYYSHYRHWDHLRYTGYHDYYYGHVRSHSPLVAVNINKGHYRTTYSRPESRRDGEALYSRTHSNRGSNVVSSRRTDPNSSRRQAGNSSYNRSSGITNERTANNSVRRSEGNSVYGNRSTSGVNERRVSNESSNRQIRSSGNSRSNSPDVYRRPASTSGDRSERISSRQTSSERPSSGVGYSRGNNAPVSAGPSSRRSASSAAPWSSSRNEQARSSAPRASRQESSGSSRRSQSTKTGSSEKSKQSSGDSDSRRSRR